jgi:phosphoglycolate phosphatase-like HAD superfamily hydrolase
MNSAISKGLIALDADGVLLDYHAGYRMAWQRAFGVLPDIKDPLAYSVMDRFGVERLHGEPLEQLRAAMDDDFWSSLQPLNGAIDACHSLVQAGYDLVCVSAIKEQYAQARLRNLGALGFPIERVFATPHVGLGQNSPKAAKLAELKPIAFVDDYAPYLKGIPQDLHAALILREPNGSPNVGEALELADSTHVNLAGFVAWWLSKVGNFRTTSNET